MTYSPEHFERMIEQNLARRRTGLEPRRPVFKETTNANPMPLNSVPIAALGQHELYLAQRWARYLEKGYPSITDNVGGFGVSWKPGLFHTLSLDARGHALTEPAENAWTGNIGIESKWTDIFSTRVEGARDIDYTARAISNNIKETIGGLMLRSGRPKALVGPGARALF